MPGSGDLRLGTSGLVVLEQEPHRINWRFLAPRGRLNPQIYLCYLTKPHQACESYKPARTLRTENTFQQTLRQHIFNDKSVDVLLTQCTNLKSKCLLREKRIRSQWFCTQSSGEPQETGTWSPGRLRWRVVPRGRSGERPWKQHLAPPGSVPILSHLVP